MRKGVTVDHKQKKKYQSKQIDGNPVIGIGNQRLSNNHHKRIWIHEDNDG